MRLCESDVVYSIARSILFWKLFNVHLQLQAGDML